MSASDTIFKVKGYKGFQDDFSGFDSIKPINIIIGRNNTGKSSLLDIIEHLCIKMVPAHKQIISHFPITDVTELKLSDNLKEDEIKQYFRSNINSITNQDPYWKQNGLKYTEKKLNGALEPRILTC